MFLSQTLNTQSWVKESKTTKNPRTSFLLVGINFNDFKMGLYKAALSGAPGVSSTLSLWPVVPEASVEMENQSYLFRFMSCANLTHTVKEG